MTEPMPTLFISHGPPTLAAIDHPAPRFWETLAQRIPRPSAIICVSAHWEAVRPTVTGAAMPGTVHDFGGPPPLFSLSYPAPGDPDLAERVRELLDDAGPAAGIDPDRGLDHGVWVPLIRIYPEADIPVLQLSVQTDAGPAHHLAIGRALAPLRREGVLILGSGGATHDLPSVSDHQRDDPPTDYARAFDDWLRETITAGNIDALLDYEKAAPEARRNHPWPAEHFLPLFVPLGAAVDSGPGRRIFDGFMYGVLSMAVYRWGNSGETAGG
jgi:4,5-DOPA dioxygenase extradiol